MEAIYNDIVRLLTSTGPWLSKKWLYVLPAIGILCALLLIYFNLIPTIPEKEGKVIFQYYKWAVILLLPILFVLIWLLGTQIYLRTGTEVKIGLAYEGYKIDISDWKQTKTILKDLFKDEKLKNRVSLRFVPLRVVEAEKIGRRFAKRYGFTIILTLQQSETVDKKKPLHIGFSITTKQQALPYIKTNLQNTIAILSGLSNQQNKTAFDIIKNKALSLHNMLLLFVATHHFVSEHYEDASVILRHIDDSLKDIFPPVKQPRLSIREMDARCCISKLTFPISDIPLPDDLERRIRFAERAMCYFDTFAFVYASIARARFLAGDLHSAIELTRQCSQVIERLQSQGKIINPTALSTFYLNSGFLFFVQGHWHNSFSSYQKLLHDSDFKNQTWDGLVAFIDYVASLEFYEGIQCLQVLYRKIAGQPVSSSLNQAALNWIRDDGSRKSFEELLSSAPNIFLSNKKRKLRNKKHKRKK